MPNLLLLDDDPTLRRAFRRVLRGTHEVHEAGLISAAWELLAAHRYERAIVDVSLPDGDGVAFLKDLRNRGFAFPVLLVTGGDDRALSAEAVRYDAMFAFKPIPSNVIVTFAQPAPRSPAPTLPEFAGTYARENRLSRRQTDLVLALARGVPRHSLAAELGLAEDTIKTMVKEILRKCHMSSTDAIVCLLLEQAERSRLAT